MWLALQISGNLDSEKELRQRLRTGQMTLSNQILHCKGKRFISLNLPLPQMGAGQSTGVLYLRGPSLLRGLRAKFLTLQISREVREGAKAREGEEAYLNWYSVPGIISPGIISGIN